MINATQLGVVAYRWFLGCRIFAELSLKIRENEEREGAMVLKLQ
jgi:hypothetical protein